jgi:membrane protein DedA with SNARE-associated domain/membrane-associated phospholipid phosphatase
MRWGWLLTAVALAGFLVVRRRHLSRLLLAAGAIATVAALLIGTGVVKLPNVEKLIEDAGTALGPWTYLLVGLLAFLETGAFIGLVAPGETAVLVGGLVAGQGQISLIALIAIVWTCAVLGDVTSYVLGRRLGRAWLVRHGERLKISEHRLDQVERFFDRHGGPAILVGRFIGLVRALLPFIAGASKVPLRVYLPYDVVGAGAWAGTFCVLGYVFWQSFHQLAQYVSRGLLAFSSFVAIVVGLYFLVQVRRDPRRREQVKAWLREREDQPLLRPLVRLAAPAWKWVLGPTAEGVDRTARFGLDRLRPGSGLGLELTTMVALAAVGLFNFMLLGQIVREPGEPEIDRIAADVANQLVYDPLTSVVKVVTQLGSLTVTAVLVAATTIWAARWRRWVDAAALVAGIGISYLAGHATKALFDRPRPAGGLVEAGLSSFPSAHTLYAVALVACATVLVRAGSGWAARFAVVTAAVIAVAVVGLCGVYLRVAYLTDALGGAALGIAIWALIGIAALFAGHVRHNESPR